jgi:hypothetical protein
VGEAAPPANPDVALSLQALGYDVGNLDGAVRAFNRHFMALDDSPVLSPEALGVLDCLVRKARAPEE